MPYRVRILRIVAVSMVVWGALGAVATAHAVTGARDAGGRGANAVFDGREISLADGNWEGAEACLIDVGNDIAECFTSEAAMNERVADLETAAGATRAASCSSSVRLYDGSFAGQVLYLSGRGLWINLSIYGFSNRTSSYKIGACSSYFADYSNGQGSWYPTGATQAYDQATAMNSGWNNRVSSIYIT